MSHVPLPAPGTAGNVITSTGDGWASEPGGGGGGAVDSVNGQTGVVVLDAADVGADASGTAASAVATHAALTVGVHGITAVGENLITAANETDQRAALELGSAAQSNITAFGDSLINAADAAAAVALLGISAGGVYGTATATFSNGADSVTVTVVDAGVSAGSKIVPSVAMGSRDADEFEMAPVAVAVGTITAGVGFTIIAVSLDGDAEGAYQINYTRD